MTYVSRKLASSVIIHGEILLLINGYDKLLNQRLLNSTYFVENLEILVVH